MESVIQTPMGFCQFLGDIMDKRKVILVLIGFATILGFLASFLQSRSPLDLFFITIGVIIAIIGFYIDGERGNLPVKYFVAVFSVNIFQWLILIYVFLMNQVFVTGIFFYFLVGTLMFTIAIIIQIHRNKQKYNGNHKTTNTCISAYKMKAMLEDKGKVFYMSVGFLITIVCLTSFLFSKSPLEIYGIFVGMMAVIYGFYRENKKFIVTENSFLAIFAVIILQWLILVYIWSNIQVYYFVYTAREISIPSAITMGITIYFCIIIRASKLKITVNWQGIKIGNKKIF